MEKNNYILIFASACFIFLINSISFSSDNITILESNNSQLHFILHVNLSELNSRLQPNLTTAYYQTVSIGIPVGSTVKLETASGMGILKSESVDKILKNKIHNAPLVKISSPVSIRGREVVNLKIYPVRKGFVYETVEVMLSFEGASVSNIYGKEDGSHFDKLFEASLLNHEQSKKWLQPVSNYKSKSLASLDTPFNSEINWYRILVRNTGLYKITGQDLINAGFSGTINSNMIYLYNAGGLPLSIDNLTERPSLMPVAVLVDDGGDSHLDANDEIYFYGESVNRWLFSPDTFVNNAYTDFNVYWLTISGNLGTLSRMLSVDGTVTGVADTTFDSFRRRVHTEQDNLLRKFNGGEIYDYYQWYWTDQNNLKFFVQTPERKAGSEADIYLAGRTFGVSGVSGYMDIEINGVAGNNKLCNTSSCQYTTAALNAGNNEIDLSFVGFSTVAPYFDYIDIEYTATLTPSRNELDITLGEFDGRAKIDIVDNFTGVPVVFDITDPLQPKSVINYSQSSSKVSFEYVLEADNFNRFLITPLNNSLTPVLVQKVLVKNLRNDLSQVDMFVIAPKRFENALNEYISYREADGYSIDFVSIEDIMDNFSYGLYDPAAIRDFLKFAYENYPAPSPTYVLFVGDGSYDFHDNLETGIDNLVPPFVHPYDIEQFYSDDNYLYFGRYGIIDSDTSYDTSSVSPDRGFDMISARWPVKSEAEIAVITNKIKDYELPEKFGDWKTNITIVADDEYTTYSSLESIHTRQAEQLDKNHIPQIFKRDKIYLWEYPFVNRKKPAVNNRIVNAINKGTLLINYVGHGNPDLWAHEHVFTRTDDLPRLNNSILPLVFTASCEIAFFDDPKREGMAEDLLSMKNGGIGVISATRRVYSGPNAEFNRKVFDVLFGNKNLSVCEAMYSAKLIRQYKTDPPTREDNDQAYLFFGDPLMKLGIPKFNVKFTQAPDSIVALQPISVSGYIVDDNNQIVNKNGSVDITVYDSDREKTHYVLGLDGIPRDTIVYEVSGPKIFSGVASVDNGVFEFTFVPPVDINYGKPDAKIYIYANLGDIDAAGIIDSISVSSVIATNADSTGPQINYTFAERNGFISGDYIRANEKLVISIEDSSGINLTGNIGHGLTLVIDKNEENTIDLTDSFKYTQNNFISGSLSYEIQDLTIGEHNFKIKAWDNANNSSTVEFTAVVIMDDKLAIKDLLNYPNPMKDSTRFSFTLTRSIREMVIEIYTLSGRKIRSLVDYSSRGPGYYDDIVWYGEDFDLSPVATGIYIFKATAVPEDGSEIAEQFGKIVIIN